MKMNLVRPCIIYEISLVFNKSRPVLVSCRLLQKRLLESKQTTPHLYLSKGLYSFTAHVIFMMFDVIDIMIGVALFSDVVLDPLLAFRSELKGVLFISFYLVFSVIR